MVLSADFKQKINSIEGEAPLYVLEITHPLLHEPILVVNDNLDLISNGRRYVALAFNIKIPEDMQKRLPQATLTIDNVGRELTQWLDDSNGGEGAMVKIMLIMRSAPDVVEFSLDMELKDVSADVLEVSGQLGYENLLQGAAVILQHRPDVTPGIF